MGKRTCVSSRATDDPCINRTIRGHFTCLFHLEQTAISARKMPVKSDHKNGKTTCFASAIHCEHNMDASRYALMQQQKGKWKQFFAIEWHLKLADLWATSAFDTQHARRAHKTYIFCSKDFIAPCTIALREHKLHTDKVLSTRYAHYTFPIKKQKGMRRCFSF